MPAPKRNASAGSESGKVSRPSRNPQATSSLGRARLGARFKVSENPPESNRAGGRIYHDFTWTILGPRQKIASVTTYPQKRREIFHCPDFFLASGSGWIPALIPRASQKRRPGCYRCAAILVPLPPPCEAGLNPILRGRILPSFDPSAARRRLIFSLPLPDDQNPRQGRRGPDMVTGRVYFTTSES